jgi:hypothetical protein
MDFLVHRFADLSFSEFDPFPTVLLEAGMLRAKAAAVGGEIVDDGDGLAFRPQA